VNSTSKPTLIWDGECDFCRAWVERWRAIIGDRIEFATYQDAGSRFPDVPREAFARAVHLIEPEAGAVPPRHRVSRGAEAVFRSLAYAPGHGFWLSLYLHLPLFWPISEAAYAWTANHRPPLFRLTRVLWGPHVAPPGERLTTAIFLRVLGAIFAIAFVSLWVQVIGLVGARGILPAADYLHAVAQQVGPIRLWALPTLCWLNASDAGLHALCAVGTLSSLALMLGFVPFGSLLVAWVCYLSLATVCRDFLWFQWDSLLIEAGFLALFLTPRVWRSRSATDPPPSRAALWLVRALLFRLMLSSAAVKWTSGDPTWRTLTALTFHYQTQPLPTWTAWFMHQLPASFHRASVIAMFIAEGAAPFLIFAPRRIRFLGAALMTSMQLLIFATGNYGFFNPLAIALCIPLLDDGIWPWRWGRGAVHDARKVIGDGDRKATIPAPRWGPRRLSGIPNPAGTYTAGRHVAVRITAAVLIFIGLVPLFHALQWPDRWLGPAPIVYRLISPFRIVDPYGLFAVMTMHRPEIIIEGSMDGATWKPYEFRWKPGDVRRRPEFIEPHMPRLDWQMWFAALGDVRNNEWFLALCERLLQGSPPVRALFLRAPFGATPPKFIRAELFEYRFTDRATRRATGVWWRAEPRGLYAPPLMLVNGRLALADLSGGTP
jgi:predicted DCC family thiol-disulfide oxidoreductase YuxK